MTAAVLYKHAFSRLRIYHLHSIHAVALAWPPSFCLRFCPFSLSSLFSGKLYGWGLCSLLAGSVHYVMYGNLFVGSPNIIFECRASPYLCPNLILTIPTSFPLPQPSFLYSNLFPYTPNPSTLTQPYFLYFNPHIFALNSCSLPNQLLTSAPKFYPLPEPFSLYPKILPSTLTSSLTATSFHLPQIPSFYPSLLLSTSISFPMPQNPALCSINSFPSSPKFYLLP